MSFFRRRESRPATWEDSVFYRYHEATKHSYASVYGNPGYLDWDNQPDPFRVYEGAPEVVLPIPARPEAMDFFHPRQIANPSLPWTLQEVSRLLFYSVSLSAWKYIPGTEHRWSLRVNPSSGNLHPTETYLITQGVSGLPDGVYHFRVDRFLLEARYQGSVDGLLERVQAISGLACGGVTILLTSIFWREAWKYRARAFRYCHHDLGHALGCVTEALSGLGHASRYRHLFDDAGIEELLQLTEGEERPGVIITTGQPASPHSGPTPGVFQGKPNALSSDALRYRLIEDVYDAARRASSPGVADAACPLHEQSPLHLANATTSPHDFWDVVRKRRSAVDMDGETGITAEQLGAILKRAALGADGDVFGPDPRSDGRYFVHLFLYLHRISGIDPGVYYYNRQEHTIHAVKPGDVREAACSLSLGQTIASHGAFAVSMIADFPRAFAAFGERAHRAVHLEAGHIGQGLYLGAESAGINSTGIGAFFDDDVNRFLNTPKGMEVIYHFTVGRGIDDPRIKKTYGYEWELGTNL